MGNRKIVARILRECGKSDIMDCLSIRLALSDLQSLLLEVYRKRIKNRTSKQVFEQYRKNRFVQPSSVPPLDQMDFDRLAFSLLPDHYKTVELSPVSPLGSASVLAPVNQNNVLTTIRNTEVNSDSTNVLAMECAQLRQKQLLKNNRSKDRVCLCASHRALRTQLFDEPGAFPHFRIFSLCTAGRDTGSYHFEISTLKEQIDYYLRLLKFTQRLKLQTDKIRTIIFPFDERITDTLQSAVTEPLSHAHPNVTFQTDYKTKDGSCYYTGVRFQIYARNRSNKEYFLVDGGFTDWTQQLLSDKKERLLISGLGSERLIVCFK